MTAEGIIRRPILCRPEGRRLGHSNASGREAKRSAPQHRGAPDLPLVLQSVFE
jgi:hypothetical protein